jgi:tetratricopeptide (TPR) repeat protein
MGCDAAWKLITERANRAHQSGKAAFAFALYQAALTEAERLFEVARRGSEPEASSFAPMLYNISSHNLAELSLQQGDSEAAMAAFERAFERVLEAAAADESPLGLRVSCARHLQIATAALTRFLFERGDRERAEEAARRANEVSSAVVELARQSAR